MFLGSGHRVTGEFRRSQIVTPVAAECIARMGVTTPWIRSARDEYEEGISGKHNIFVAPSGAGERPRSQPASGLRVIHLRKSGARALSALPGVDVHGDESLAPVACPPACATATVQRLESLKGVAAVTRCGWCLRVQCTVC